MKTGKNGTRFRDRLQRYMLRPFIHMTFTRFLLALTAGLLIPFFLNDAAGQDLRESCFLVLTFLFALLALIAWLRLDGVKLPKLMMLRVNPRKKPTRSYGDMADWMDEEPQIVFEDLEDDEKDICLLGADLVCMIGMLAAALIVG